MLNAEWVREQPAHSTECYSAPWLSEMPGPSRPGTPVPSTVLLPEGNRLTGRQLGHRQGDPLQVHLRALPCCCKRAG